MFSSHDAEGVKDAARNAVNWFTSKVVDIEAMEEDLDASDDPLISPIWEVFQEMLDRIERPHQEREARYFGTLLLWVAQRDTAYRDAMLWALKRLWSRPDFRGAIGDLDPRDPDEWYANLHEDAVQRTRMLQGATPSGVEAGIHIHQHQTAYRAAELRDKYED